MVRPMSTRLALVFRVVSTTPALAEDDMATPSTPTPSTFDMAGDAAFSPGMQPANNTSVVRGLATSNYNRTTRASTLDLVGELGVYQGLHLVLRVDNVATHGRPGVGAAYQFYFVVLFVV